MNKQLSQLARQCATIWKELGLNQRVTVVLSGAGIVAVLAGLVFWSSRPDFALLYGGLEDSEAARIIAVLDDLKVPYTSGTSGGAIYVPRDKVHTARMQLATKGLPRGDGVGFEIFDRSNFGISDFIQRANYIRAIQGELARTIRQMDEVEQARVMIVVPENRLLVDSEKRATASVFIRTRHLDSVPRTSVQAIQFLVANSVEGLRPSQVTVVDNQARVLSVEEDNASLAGLSSSQLTAQRHFEDYMAQKAASMLEVVLGPGQAVVRVAAEINFDSVSQIVESYDPDSQVARSETIEDETTDTLTGGGGNGVPGVTSNLGFATNTVVSSTSGGLRTKKKTVNNEYDISKTTSNLTQLAGGLKRISAAVFVASRSTGTGTNQTIQARTPEELEKLRRIVQSALGAQVGANGVGRDEITLEEIAFNDQTTGPSFEMLPPSSLHIWWERIVNMGYGLAALALVALFWRSVKRTPVDGTGTGSARAPGARTHGSGNGRSSQPNRYSEEPYSEPKPVNVEVFNRLVQENPENLTQAIQSWLDRGDSKTTKN